MTEKEEASLRSVYQEWSVEQLVRGSTLEKNDYRPEAVTMMLEELKKRGVPEENLAGLSASLPPPILPQERDTRVLPARLNRKQYAIRWLIWAASLIVTVITFAILIEFIPALEPAVVVLACAAMIYKIIGLDIPRLKSAGLSPWLLLLFLVPLANVVIFVLLFAVPPKK